MSCDCNKKNKIRTLVGLVAGLILVCVLVSAVTSNLLTRKVDWSKHDEDDGHQWLHHELNLTPKETAAIDAFEPEYRQERAALQGQFQSKIEELRQEIISSDQFSDEAKETIHELHIIHGQLQELSIRHYYQMMQVLPPEKQERLRDIAAKALSVPQ
jgi:Spy/CpxP family protein refolding chaperone